MGTNTVKLHFKVCKAENKPLKGRGKCVDGARKASVVYGFIRSTVLYLANRAMAT